MSTLRLHHKIYLPSAVQETIDAFADFDKFELSTEGDYAVIQISEPDEDFAEILDLEFANYALANSVEKVRS